MFLPLLCVWLHPHVLRRPLHGVQLRPHHHDRRLPQEHRHHLLRNISRWRLPILRSEFCRAQYQCGGEHYLSGPF